MYISGPVTLWQTKFSELMQPNPFTSKVIQEVFAKCFMGVVRRHKLNQEAQIWERLS